SQRRRPRWPEMSTWTWKSLTRHHGRRRRLDADGVPAQPDGPQRRDADARPGREVAPRLRLGLDRAEVAEVAGAVVDLGVGVEDLVPPPGLRQADGVVDERLGREVGDAR